MNRGTFIDRIKGHGFKIQRRDEIAKLTPTRRWYTTKKFAVAFGERASRYGITVVNREAKKVVRYEKWDDAYDALIGD